MHHRRSQFDSLVRSRGNDKDGGRRIREEMAAASQISAHHIGHRPAAKVLIVTELKGDKVSDLPKFRSRLQMGRICLQLVSKGGIRQPEMTLSGAHDPRAKGVIEILERHFRDKGHCIVRSAQSLSERS